MRLKKNKIYFLIFFICLLIMILSALKETNIYNIVGDFIFNKEYRENFTLAESTTKANVNLIGVIKHVLTNYNWKFDYILIFGTNLFQILLPFIASIGGLIFFNNYNTIYNFSIHKEKSYNKSISKKILMESFKIACSIFLSFLIFYIFCFIITKGELSVYMGRTLFLDILGQGFYDKFTYLYYVLDGFIRFFMMSFIYAYLSCCLATIMKTQKQVFFSANVYYYALSIIGFGLYHLVGEYAIYVNPSVIMASGTYNNVNTILLILVNIVPMIFGYVCLRRRIKYEDIY